MVELQLKTLLFQMKKSDTKNELKVYEKKIKLYKMLKNC